VPHRNARLTVYARHLIVERRAAGWTQARTAEQLGVSRGTVSKWLARYDAEGPVGLADRSSRPRSCPTRTSDELEARVLELRRDSHRGAVFLAGELGLVASTVGRILSRHQMPALAAIDAVTGEPVRQRRGGPRYERRRPGELLHVDVKKLGRVPDGGGWRLHGRSEAVRGRGNGYDFLHVAVDDHSRIAYIEALADERDATCAGFLHRAATWFHQHGVRIERVLTDNAMSYRRGRTWAAVCVALGIRRRFIKPGCPWTNGKAERLNRTLQNEFAYARPWTSNHQRLAALDSWVSNYNTRRAHSALGGQPPITRLAC
jgi:transposase InsO family protein